MFGVTVHHVLFVVRLTVPVASPVTVIVDVPGVLALTVTLVGLALTLKSATGAGTSRGVADAIGLDSTSTLPPFPRMIRISAITNVSVKSARTERFPIGPSDTSIVRSLTACL